MEPTPHFRGGSGEPLVLLHGFSGVWRIWEPVLPMLTEHHDVLAPTLAGHHGGSPLDEGVEPTVASLADAAERQMDEAGFETAHVAGNSLGGWIGFELARRGRARSVVALAPAGGWPRGREETRLKRQFTRNHKALSLIEPWIDTLVRRPRLRRLLLRDVHVHGERVPPAAAADAMRGVLGCSVYWQLIQRILDDGPPDWLGEVKAPVLIAWPETDRVLRFDTCSEGFRAIPHAEWTTLRGAGHVPMVDDPPLVARTIVDFARKHEGVAEGVA